MKFFLTVLTLIATSTSALSATKNEVQNCFKEANKAFSIHSTDAAILCSNVSSISETSAVIKCLTEAKEELKLANEFAAVLCSNVTK